MERSLLQRIEAFLKETAMPPSLFGRRAAHDPCLVSDLRGGRVPGRRLICRTEHFMNKWRAAEQTDPMRPSGEPRTHAIGAGETQ